MVILNKEETELLKDYIDNTTISVKCLVKKFGRKKTRKLLIVVHKIYNKLWKINILHQIFQIYVLVTN